MTIRRRTKRFRSAITQSGYQNLIVPAYYYNGVPSRTVLTDNSAYLAYSGIVVVNFGNPGGFGNAPDWSCNPYCDNQVWVEELKEAHVVVLGYVDNPVGRSVNSMIGEIDNWQNWYAVNGIFFDDSQRYPMDATTEDVARMKYLQQYVYQHFSGGEEMPEPWRAVFNWGQTADLQRYVYCSYQPGPQYHSSLGNVMFSTFEGSHSQFAGATFPSWLGAYSSKTFFQLVYAEEHTGTTLWDDVDKSRRSNAGYFYLTDGPGSMPWGAIAGYNTPPENSFHNYEATGVYGVPRDDFGEIASGGEAYTTFDCPLPAPN